MNNQEREEKKTTEIESKSRRKTVKKIVGGVTALAAYQLLPVKWEKPIIEHIFLPVHAQTSGTPPDTAGSTDSTNSPNTTNPPDTTNPPTTGGTLTIVRITVSQGITDGDFNAVVAHSRTGLTGTFTIVITNITQGNNTLVNDTSWAPLDATTVNTDSWGPFPDAPGSIALGDTIQFTITSNGSDSVDWGSVAQTTTAVFS